ncbi:outer membrane receptor protein involved in Fe transport [Variibacter gotjawalensis]|nr:TonB-dependent receptor [Variibacter gotjawalensis]NIK47959.1 outer membrane receptor protein involved in Fe transport [Variibacter gotjawalensis]
MTAPRIAKPARQARPARAARQTRPRPTAAHATAATPIATRSDQPVGGFSAPVAASERDVSGSEVNAVPISRPGEALEVVPGLIVTQHSGEGKANQYFLRGFNLDHGTDFAITVDGMPVNMRTHGHGQGYADINFLIPELIQSVRIRKGPYFADEGDFASAGAANIQYRDVLNPGLAQVTGGSFGYFRTLVAKSVKAGDGNVLAAFDTTTYDGPWEKADRLRKFNGVVRYSEGTQQNGLSLTAMGYVNRWNSTDQIAERAITSGLIDRFGTLDATDGGTASRFSLSGRWSRDDETSASRIETYAIRSTMRLYNNFTYFLDDPVNGDQFSQMDRRWVLGFNASHTFKGRFASFDTETKVGVQTRYDDISLGLTKTKEREELSTVRIDRVQEASVGVYAENTTHWANWIRTVTGIRGDRYDGRVSSDTGLNSGSANDFIASPKFNLILGPWAKTELYFSAGTGFHSNDLRGVTIRVDPIDKVTPQDRVPLLVRSKGTEIGLRSKAIDGLESTLAFFVLDYDSELLFVGDAGTTEASRPSRRVGVEWTNHYRVNPWLRLDVDLAYTKARFTDVDPAGDFIPGAPQFIGSAGVFLGAERGWFGAVKARYFGPRPLVEDDSVRSRETFLVNGRVGYTFDSGIRLQLDVLNVFDTKADQIAYYYESRLPGEPGGVLDRHIHPVEPRSFRLTLAGRF